MRTSTRWTIGVLAVLAAVIVALVAQLDQRPPPPGGAGAWPTRQAHRDADTAESLAGPRQRAALPGCPVPRGGAGPESLRDVVVECAADGAPVDVGRMLADRTVVLNLWAYWCGPCAQELPAMARYQQQAGDAVTVVTVHQDENETAALLRMAELGVRLPVLQDGRRSIGAALGLPNVMPATVVVRRDGSVAEVLPRPFTSADEIAAAVNSALR